MSDIALPKEPGSGICAHSEFSATIDSTCTSEEMLYRLQSDNFYFDEDVPKTVKFGGFDIFDESEVARTNNDRTGELLLSMFSDTPGEESDESYCQDHATRAGTIKFNDPEKLSPKQRICYEDKNVTMETLRPHTQSTETASLCITPEKTILKPATPPKKKYNDNISHYESSNGKMVPFANVEIGSQNPTKVKIQNETKYPRFPGYDQHVKIKTESVNSELLTEKESRNGVPKEDMILLQEENTRLKEKIIALNAVISTQFKTINEYEQTTYTLQKDIENLFEVFDTVSEENNEFYKLANESVQSMEITKREFAAMARSQSCKILRAQSHIIPPFEEFCEEECFKEYQNRYLRVEQKNQFLQRLNTLHVHKFSDIYRQSILPALHLLGTNSEALDLMEFDNNKFASGFLSDSPKIFDKLIFLSEPNMDIKRNEEEKEENETLEEVTRMYDALNQLIAGRLLDLFTDFKYRASVD